MPKLSPELLSVLRCPVTGSGLVQEGDELVTVTADASGNKLRYSDRGRHPAAAAAGTPARRRGGARCSSTTPARATPQASAARATLRNSGLSATPQAPIGDAHGSE